jgi:hypothetical protein
MPICACNKLLAHRQAYVINPEVRRMFGVIRCLKGDPKSLTSIRAQVKYRLRLLAEVGQH